MGLVHAGPTGLPRPLTTTPPSSEKLQELASRLFLVWRKETCGLGQGQGLAASSRTAAGEAVTAGLSGPRWVWWRPRVIASYRSLSSGWAVGAQRERGHALPAGLPRPATEGPTQAPQGPDFREGASSAHPPQTLLKGDQDSALSAWGHPAPPLHTRGRGAYPRAGSRQGLPKGLQLHLLVMAYEVGQGAVAVRVPRDQVAPVPLLVDDEVPTAVAAPVKASRCGQGRSSLGASTRRPHSPPCVPL